MYGNYFKSMGYSYRISLRSVSRIVVHVCNAICLYLKNEVMPEPMVPDYSNTCNQNCPVFQKKNVEEELLL